MTTSILLIFLIPSKRGAAPAAPLLPEKVVSFTGREAGHSWHHHEHLEELARASNEWYHNFVVD